jgi:hypothetical protein
VAAAATRAPAKQRPVKAKPANLKTVVSDASVPRFLARIEDDAQREDCKVLAAMFAAATKKAPKMWGATIVGYGEYSYVGKSGRAGDWFIAGFSPRAGTLTLYMLGGWAGNKALLAKLGKHSLGKGCLYVKRLKDVDQKTLKALVADALKRAKILAPKMMVNGGGN